MLVVRAAWTLLTILVTPSFTGGINQDILQPLFSLNENNRHAETVYNLLSNKGMFGGDVRGGIGLIDKSEGTIVDDRHDPYKYYIYWPNGVVNYELDKSVDRAKNLILDSMEEIESKTCIRFRNRLGNAMIEHFINITANEPQGGCWSSVGMDSRTSQVLNLKPPGCWEKGIIIHELVHTIGFFHEHQRPDRDNYIKINYENIRPGVPDGEFAKLSKDRTLDVGVPYDFDSIMHYDNFAFGKFDSKGRQMETILPMVPGARRRTIRPIWERPYLSPYDAEEINLVYGPACGARIDGI